MVQEDGRPAANEYNADNATSENSIALDALDHWANDRYKARLGLAGANYTVQTSTDLKLWEDQKSFTADSTKVTWSGPNPPRTGKKSYRVVSN